MGSISYRGFTITKEYEVLDEQGNFMAQCDNLADARYHIDYMLDGSEV